jgi:septal ring factor EnvC (AmiA/AmiB activator)
VDIHPIEVELAKLRAGLGELHDQNAERDAALKRIGQDMESVKDALERTSFEQKQMAQEVSRLGTRMTAFSVVAVLLLVASLAVNVVLLLRVQPVLH